MQDGQTIEDPRRLPSSAGGLLGAPSSALLGATPGSTGQSSSDLATIADKSTPGRELADGALVGKYVVIAYIGGGGMGQVYLAINPDLKCHVALKVIRAGELAQPEELRRFGLECEALARFRHPNIVAVHDADQHQGRPFLVMEHLSGGSLATNRAQFQADPRTAVTMLEKVARAVEHLHAGGVLHRDLKPANVLLDAAGTPHVSDFGLVKILDSADDLTGTGRCPGTPPYMAPEQTGYIDAPLGPPTDVWALGIMLYELLVGRRPFANRERSSLFHQIATQEPDRPRTLQRGFDIELEAVVLKCLSKQPLQRFQTAGELADDLQRWLRHEPTRTRPASRLRRAGRALRRRPALTTALALLLLTALAAPAALHLRDPDRPLQSLQRTIGHGEPFTCIGATGEPGWSRWLVQATASATLDRTGYFTIDALGDAAMLELARELPAASYEVRAKVRHNTGVGAGLIGIYVGGRSAQGPDATAQFFVALKYNGIVDHGKEFALRVAGKPGFEIPAGNAVMFAASLAARHDREAPWGASFGGPSNVRVLPSGALPDQWRDLLITVRADAVHARFDGMPVESLVLANYHPMVQRDFTAMVKQDRQRLGFLDAFPPQFDPQGSLGLYAMDSSASFAEVVITPLTNEGADQ